MICIIIQEKVGLVNESFHLNPLQMGQGKVFGGVSYLCWHAALIANGLWIPLGISKNVKVVNKVEFGTKVTSWCILWSLEGVTALGMFNNVKYYSGVGISHRYIRSQYRP